MIAGGVSNEGQGARVVQGVPTSGSIPSGARVEREVQYNFAALKSLRLALREPDFTTAVRIETQINKHLGRPAAVMLDAGTVDVDVAAAGSNSPAHLLVNIESLAIAPERRAKVVVDQRSGTIVIGESVRISRVAVSQGGLTLRIQEAPVVSQPNPFSDGETVELPRTNAQIDQAEGTGLAEVSGGTTLSQIVEGLNALGVAPHDMIDVLKTIHAAGALHAELVVM